MASSIVTRSSRNPGPGLRILLSNDDGYLARGLQRLAKELRSFAQVIIVAPDRNRSGASNSLTLEVPLRVEQVDEHTFYVNGTPTDCVHVALTGLLDRDPDMVVSGINHGPNLGDDVLYSGTVAAAMEGRFLGLPAMAVSLATEGQPDFELAAEISARLVKQLVANPLAANTILSVNVPSIAREELRGIEVTRLGFRHRAEPVVKTLDPRQRPVYWVGSAGEGQDNGPGTDFHAIDENKVSVTPIKVDLTDHAALGPVKTWLDDRPW